MASKNDYTIRAVDRALGVLDLFIEKGDSLTLKEISEYSNQPMPTASYLVRLFLPKKQRELCTQLAD